MNIKIIILITAIAILLLVYTFSEMKKFWKRKNNIPVDDEMSRTQKLLAGSRSFHISLFLWLLLFIFNRYFNEVETMLGIGILGSALVYGIYLWYYKLKGTGHEQQN